MSSGLLGYGIAHIRRTTTSSISVPSSKQRAERWGFFFLIFGSVTIVYGGLMLYALPDSPMTARWLTPRERNDGGRAGAGEPHDDREPHLEVVAVPRVQ